MPKPINPQPAALVIPEGYALIKLEHLPDFALLALLGGMKRISREINLMGQFLAKSDIVEDDIWNEVSGEDVRVANAAAVAISDEIAVRGIEVDKVKAQAEAVVRDHLNKDRPNEA